MKLGDLFYLNKGDRQVLLVLLSIALVALAVAYFAGGDEPEKQVQTLTANTRNGQSKGKGEQQQKQTQEYYNVEGRHVELFPFDPNTADSTQLLRLGLQPWQIRNIYKYRAAGGIYREKADFANLYGLTVKKYRELEPYITISDDYLPASTLHLPRHSYDANAASRQNAETTDTTGQTRRYTHKIAKGETVDLNALDTTVYQRVPGIGSYYARRLAEYGRRLGGFVSMEQLGEIDDFPMESVIFFEIKSKDVQKININRLSLNELKRHPYINYYQARAIVDYRRQQGPISDLHELGLLDAFNENAISRLLPYVDY